MELKYNKQYGLKIIKELKKHSIKSTLIGALPSSHDIDILIKNKDTEKLRKQLKNVLSITSYKKTDWDGMFAKTKYGTIDIFFKYPK